MKPFISYIGSKQKFMKKIEPYLPKEINNYYEPFVGGGSMFFHVNQHYDIKKNYINDLDADLINVYKIIKKNADELITHLDELECFSSKKDFKTLLDIYNSKNSNKVLKSAFYIYICKRSFNANLHYTKKSRSIRAHHSHQKKNTKLYDKLNISLISKLLKKTSINTLDYIDFINNNSPSAGDFVFIDPPYLVDNVKQYYKDVFDIDNFKKLKNICDILDKKKICFMVTLNNNNKLKDLFKDYNIFSFKKTYSGISNGKGNEHELIITNYIF